MKLKRKVYQVNLLPKSRLKKKVKNKIFEKVTQMGNVLFSHLRKAKK
jgi:hypothetical protein